MKEGEKRFHEVLKYFITAGSNVVAVGFIFSETENREFAVF